MSDYRRQRGWRPAGGEALLTDLYQLTMLQTYVEHGMQQTAVFEFFVRELPERRNFLLAAGLEQALDYLEELRFSEPDLEWLRGSGKLSGEFVDWLAGLRFGGDVHAMPEGTPFFPDEPIIRITAPLPQAQLVESRVMNLLHFQTLVASKAVRCVLAARGAKLVDFGLRRSHGAEAGVLAARAAYLAGFAGTATVAAARDLGIPCLGTMAHSFIQAHDEEIEAFRRFARSHPDNNTLLIDTYSTLEGARRAVALAHELAPDGIRIGAVRIDSGDLGELARGVRRILDEGGCRATGIFASGGVDEDKLQRLVQSGAPIDGYGIGTALTTATDAPALDSAYKLQEYAGVARRKRSEGKATWPGRKQVYRRSGDGGTYAGDVLTVEEDQSHGAPLILLVMRNGRRIEESPPLERIRECTAAQVRRLPEAVRRLEPDGSYRVEVAAPLRELARRVDALTGS